MGSADYRGKFLKPLQTEKQRKKKFKHPVFLYTPASEDCAVLTQTVNVYEHNEDDFYFNAKRIIAHYRKYLGEPDIAKYTLGQSIKFRVYKGQKKPFELSLYKFFINYTMLEIPILMGAPMENWRPWCPKKWTSRGWVDRVDDEIYRCRQYGNMRELCEHIENCKYQLNMFTVEAGERIGLSISNLDFIKVMQRSKEAYKSITCTYDIPDDITPGGLEALTKARARDLMDFISSQEDLPLSVYTKNGLFNPGQFREYAVHIGHKPDLNGNTIPFTSKTNILMGTTDAQAYMIDAHGGRKAELIKLKVAKAGALERSLSMLLSGIKTVDNDYECDSKHFRVRHVSSLAELKYLDGRVCTLDVNSNKYIAIDPRNDEYGLVGKTIYLKTPITCTHPDRSKGIICRACYGLLLSPLNCDVHVGRLSALNSADEIEQGMLSAKHTLMTDTDEVSFNSNFDTYFKLATCQFGFNDDMIDNSVNASDEFKTLYLVLNTNEMVKNKDGENRHYDRGFKEVIIYDEQDDSRVSVCENNGSLIYLSPELNEYYFLDAYRNVDDSGEVRIPFTDLIDTGKPTCEVLFEYQYKNNELADALVKLESILGKASTVGSYENYNDCLDDIIPLFIKGGIKLPEIHIEMIVSQLIFDVNGGLVDWTEEAPEYKFVSITKAILSSNSVTTSLLYREASKQIGGNYGTYDKTGVSDYDEFLLDYSVRTNKPNVQ